MSRSGYSEECENVQLWRGAVDRAIRGKRGQALLREMLEALDAMPTKRLIRYELQNPQGEVCALGSVGAKRGMDMADLDPEAPWEIANRFGVASALVQEIEYMNDEAHRRDETPEERWGRMRAWVAQQLVGGSPPKAGEPTNG